MVSNSRMFNVVWFRNLVLSSSGLIVLVTASTSTTTADSSATSATEFTSLISFNYKANHVRQQLPGLASIPVPVVTTSSSSFNWWPYPPAGAVPTTTTTTTTSAPPVSMDNTDLALSFITSSLSSNPTSATLPSTTTDTNTTFSANDPSSASSPSIIQITALPPLPSDAAVIMPVTQHKLRPPSHVKMVYLVPLFVLLGVVLGSACAWLGYGCYRRGPKRKRGGRGKGGELEVGPAYCDLRGGGEEEREKGSWVARKLFVDRKSEGSGQKEMECGGKGDEVFRWPTFGRRAAGDNCAGADLSDMLQGDEWREEGNPFLAEPSLHRPPKSIASRPKSTKSYRTARSKSSRTAKSVYSDTGDSEVDPLSLVSPMQYHSSDEEEGEKVPWESLRHKSIKRGILERVGEEEEKWRLAVRDVESGVYGNRSGQGGRRRISHGRQSSDLNVEDVRESVVMQRLKKLYSRGTSGGKDESVAGSASRASSTKTSGSGRSVREKENGDATEWAPGSGFRIIQDVQGMKEEMKYGDVVNTDRGRGGDRYTVLPARKARERSESPVKDVSPEKRRGRYPQSLPRYDSMVLPQSPPQITSPPLDSQLCFTPTTAYKTVAAGPAVSSRSRGDSRRGPASESPTAPGKRNGRARAGENFQSLYSVPSSFSSPEPVTESSKSAHCRSGKSVPTFTALTATATATQSPRNGNNKAGAGRAAVISSVNNSDVTMAGEGRRTPAQRYRARQGALRKVDEIVERSWSTRDLGPDGVRSLSPTGFGARV